MFQVLTDTIYNVFKKNAVSPTKWSIVITLLIITKWYEPDILNKLTSHINILPITDFVNLLVNLLFNYIVISWLLISFIVVGIIVLWLFSLVFKNYKSIFFDSFSINLMIEKYTQFCLNIYGKIVTVFYWLLIVMGFNYLLNEELYLPKHMKYCLNTVYETGPLNFISIKILFLDAIIYLSSTLTIVSVLLLLIEIFRDYTRETILEDETINIRLINPIKLN